MKKRNLRNIGVTIGLFASFILWTVAITILDVHAIGPNDSLVGFATFNGFFHKLTGVHMEIYAITDWLGLIPLCFALGFAILGLVQLIQRKSFLKVDYSILVLGGFYILVIASYLFFEKFVINYRPVLIEGNLEASYPSSTTLLVLCIMPTAMMQLNTRIRNNTIKKVILSLLAVFTAFVVIGRLISGVHWFTDIIGGVLLSSGLVMLYYSVSNLLIQKD